MIYWILSEQVLKRLYARMRMHMSTLPGTHLHARTCKHALIDQSVIVIAFEQQQWFRERASLFRYRYIFFIALQPSWA